jgi:hypothetical protein
MEEVAMASHTGRLSGLALALLAFFVLWAAVAAHPWTSAVTKDPRLEALAQRERRLRADAALVHRVVDRRFATYKLSLAKRRREIAAAQRRASAAAAVSAAAVSAPSVRVVTLPPLVITRTS